MARGAFIVIEGLDRSGKTTQTELLTSVSPRTAYPSSDANFQVSKREKHRRRKKKRWWVVVVVQRNNTSLRESDATTNACQIARRAQAI